MSDLTEQLHNYFTLRGALLSFQQLPWQLEATQAEQLQQAVATELAITERALSSGLLQPLENAEEHVQEGIENFLQLLQRHGSASSILAQAGLDTEVLEQLIATELQVADVLERVVADVGPDEEELQALYEQNRQRFVAPERREAFHILVTINDEYADNCREQALERITQLSRQLVGEGANFGEVAQRHSECPTALEQGRLGVVAAGQLYPELDEQLFAMSHGEISPVIESPLGFHLLRCGVIEPPRPLTWDEVKESLSQRLMERARKRRLQAWLRGM